MEFIQTASEQSEQTRNYGTTHIPVENQEVGGLSPRRPADRQLRLDRVCPVRQTLQGPNTVHRRPLRQGRPRITNREKCVSDSSRELMLFALSGPSPSPSPKLRYGRDVTVPTHLFLSSWGQFFRKHVGREPYYFYLRDSLKESKMWSSCQTQK